MALQPLAVPGIYAFSDFSRDEPLLTSCHLVTTEAGNMLIDPLPMDDRSHREIERMGGVMLVVVMTPARAAHTAAFSERYGASIIDKVKHRQPLLGGSFAIALGGQGKSDAFAAAVADRATVVVGDVLIGSPGGGLSLPFQSDDESARTAALGLRPILQQNPQRLLLGQGQSLYNDAYATLYRLLYATAGAAVHRINLDELDYSDGRDERDVEPSQFRVADAEVGFAIGARMLGYRVSTLLPGFKFCPLHGHAREEEMFFVLDGAPSVRTLKGTIRCRKGDFIALPAGETGTHQLLNESDAPATVLLLGRTEEVEACYYPDSDKLLLDTPTPFVRGEQSIIVRGTPSLDYFDGEEPA